MLVLTCWWSLVAADRLRVRSGTRVACGSELHGSRRRTCGCRMVEDYRFGGAPMRQRGWPAAHLRLVSHMEAGKVGFSGSGVAALGGGHGGALAAAAAVQVLVCCFGRVDGEAAHEGGVRCWELASRPQVFWFWALSSPLSVYLDASGRWLVGGLSQAKALLDDVDAGDGGARERRSPPWRRHCRWPPSPCSG